MRPIVITRQLGAADADGISLAQATLAAANLTIDGAFASGGIATLDQQRKVAIASTLNLSGDTFTVTGTNQQEQVIEESLAGPNAGSVSTLLDFLIITQIAVDGAIGVFATGVLTLTGNAVAAETVTVGTQVYTWESPVVVADDVLVGASASDSIDNLIAAIINGAGEGTAYGTGTVANVDATAAVGVGDTMDATAIAPGAAGNLVATEDTMGVEGDWGAAFLENGVDGISGVGTSGIGASDPIPIDQYLTPTNIGLGITIGAGTVDVTVQHTFGDIFDGDPSAIRAWLDHATLVNVVADDDGNLAFPPRAVRLLINSGVDPVTLTLVQAGAGA